MTFGFTCLFGMFPYVLHPLHQRLLQVILTCIPFLLIARYPILPASNITHVVLICPVQPLSNPSRRLIRYLCVLRSFTLIISRSRQPISARALIRRQRMTRLLGPRDSRKSRLVLQSSAICFYPIDWRCEMIAPKADGSFLFSSVIPRFDEI